MKGKYAGSEVLQMAVELEKKGKTFYESVAKNIKDEKARNVFQFLADEEVKHEEVFNNMLAKTETKGEKNPYDNREVVLYFRSLVDKKIFPAEEYGKLLKDVVNNPGVAIRIAISLEKDSVLFYNELLPLTEGRNHEVVKKIIGEERDHIHRILQLKDELSI